MSVFLRWGVFGILGVAALLYAYNASKRMAESHAAQQAQETAAQPAPQVVEKPRVEVERARPAPPPEPARSTPPHCEAELVVAQRALEMRKQGAPLDRVLRMQEIAWNDDPARRLRLESVATRWFGYEGDFSPEALRIAVINDCARATPAP